MSDSKVYKDLVKFWKNAFKISEDDKNEILNEMKEDDYKSLAPSAKLIRAVEELHDLNNVLDYGCGIGWASIICAKKNSFVTSVDVTESSLELLKLYSNVFNVNDKINIIKIDSSWLKGENDNKYDGIISSNVLDVLPKMMSEEIVKEFYRILKNDSYLIVGLNYYIEPNKAREAKMNINDDNELYIDGVLRLLDKSDDEWIELFSKYFNIEKLEYFAWEGEDNERRRLFYLRKK